MIKKYVSAIIRRILLPLAIAGLGGILAVVFFFNSDINPNIRSYNHEIGVVKNVNGDINGKFTSNDYYLSLITIRFENKITPTGDSVFRIKDILSKDWYQIATISASNYFVVPQYIFGFPPIAKSKNKTYEFEVQMVDGSNQLSLSNKYPVLISQYQYPKNILLGNKKILIEFIIKKLSYYIYGESAWKVFAVYSIPFFAYLFFLFTSQYILIKKYIEKAKTYLYFLFNPYMFVVFVGIFIDIFVIRKYSDSVTVLFTLLWVVGAAAYKLESRESFGVALVFLIFCPFLLWADMSWVAEKSAVWAFMFLVVGTFHAMIELKAEESPKLKSILNFASQLLSFITHTDIFIKMCVTKIKSFAFSSVLNFVKTIILFIVITFLLLLSIDAYLKYMSYLDRQLKNPGVPLIEPSLVYPGTKVFLYGDRFGDGASGKYALMRNGAKIRVDYWEDHKIIFTVPLDWKTGNIDIWIEKPVEWNGETIIEKTKPITIKLLKVTDKFTPDDELYFEQMKTWRQETKV